MSQNRGLTVETTTIAIDLAKNVFELAVADGAGKVVDRKRLSRNQLRRYFENYPAAHVVMEAWGSAHYWGRWFAERGMRVSLLPPHYVRAYVRRNKIPELMLFRKQARPFALRHLMSPSTIGGSGREQVSKRSL
jgi:transposase